MRKWAKLTALLSMLAILTTVLLAGPAAPQARAAEPETAELVIMATTDLHGNVYPWDYFKNAQSEVGLAKAFTLIKQVREAHPATLLLDVGDALQGTPLDYYFVKVEPLQPGTVHPVVKAMNLMGYEAAAVGNHEYNYGLEFLNEATNDATFPYLSANIYKAGTEEPYHTPYVIIEKTLPGGSTVKVGVIGFTPPGVMIWDYANLNGKVEAGDIVAAARRFVPEMQAKGAEVIVALAHTGYVPEGKANSSYDTSLVPAENVARELAEQVTELDVVFVGHSHSYIPGTGLAEPRVGDVLINQPGYWANNLGVVTLQLTRQDGRWTVSGGTSEIRSVKGVEPAAEVLEAVKAEHEKTVAYVNKAIGKTATPLQTHAALLTDTHAIQLINDVQIARVKEALRGTEYESLPVLSAAAPFNLSVNVPAGEVSVANIASLYIYDNTLKALLITGKDLKGWLEHSAKQFLQVTPGSGAEPMLNKDWRAYNFDQIDGVSYEIDVTRPAGERIVNLRYQGAPVTDEMKFVIATNNYRAGGGGGFPGTGAGAAVVYDQLEESRQLIIDYVQQKGTVEPQADNNWRIVPNFLDHWSARVTYELMAKGIALPDAQGRMNLDAPITNLEYVALLERAGLTIPVATAATEEGPVSRATGMELLAYALVGEAGARAEAAVLSRFADATALSGTTQPAVAWAVANGLVRGDAQGLLRPGDSLTRAEAFQMLWNGLNR